MLVIVVPSLLAITPPTNGVQVLLRVNADIRRLNSVLDVPKSRRNRDFNGARTYCALPPHVDQLEKLEGLTDALMTANTERASTQQSQDPDQECSPFPQRRHCCSCGCTRKSMFRKVLRFLIAKSGAEFTLKRRRALNIGQQSLALAHG